MIARAEAIAPHFLDPAHLTARIARYHASMSLSRILRFDTHTARLRGFAFLEALSFVVLVFVAVPVKYLAGEPLLVRIVGPIHGVLFIALAYLAWESTTEHGKSRGWAGRVVLFALLPFGAFFLDRGLAEDDEAFRSSQGG